MRSRVPQPILEDEEDQEAFFGEPSMIGRFQLAFRQKKHFPILMLSYVGPQHGRLFYAYWTEHSL
ncbi:hypothetical protein ASPZODRAFT_130289 [Penicilliopsis zonata CBS 506.65]|uniref:Uncharacterized protein n=1 Tax=Penicilliopsis zonata CBS 506.65 TaxID=1073090 RepID=A0A1L9SMI8_9EURO|nr:hypothetical protein ASPZODRAFT_130289 [Penicilliopsis zonata CBS 506.65]OJJ48311.1 hypothetical protein ASPZODRAFT_130289 [Penicilliopsis zonata CBS 506.65]